MFRYIACVAIAAMFTVSCRARPPVAAAPPVEVVPPDISPGPVAPIAWSLERPLTWSDFRARPTLVGGTGAAALTASRLTSRFACSGERFGFEITALFLPDQSWVKPALFVQPGSGHTALRHEQTHFDLTEVHARRARQYFGGLAAPCGPSMDQLETSIERFTDELGVDQDRYDRETLNGRDAGAQISWDTNVRRRLESLEVFTAPPSTQSHRDSDPR
jgi:hypothetical protein